MRMTDNATRYLSLLKKSLINELYIENEARIAQLAFYALVQDTPPQQQLVRDFLQIERSEFYACALKVKPVGGGISVFTPSPDGVKEFDVFKNFAYTAHSMIGRSRMQNLHYCLDRIIAADVPGDLIETGVWKGGATIFMRGYLAAHGITDRIVWAADSFEGLPPPSLAQDAGTDFSKDKFPYLAVSLEQVKALFARYDLLDDQVRFLKGWFKDTLPAAPIERLALLRLDGDMYESTMDALTHLYHKVSPGGFVIIDDYRSYPGCQQAVDEFRARHGIVDALLPIDGAAFYWRKERPSP